MRYSIILSIAAFCIAAPPSPAIAQVEPAAEANSLAGRHEENVRFYQAWREKNAERLKNALRRRDNEGDSAYGKRVRAARAAFARSEKAAATEFNRRRKGGAVAEAGEASAVSDEAESAEQGLESAAEQGAPGGKASALTGPISNCAEYKRAYFEAERNYRKSVFGGLKTADIDADKRTKEQRALDQKMAMDRLKELEAPRKQLGCQFTEAEKKGRPQ